MQRILSIQSQKLKKITKIKELFPLHSKSKNFFQSLIHNRFQLFSSSQNLNPEKFEQNIPPQSQQLNIPTQEELMVNYRKQIDILKEKLKEQQPKTLIFDFKTIGLPNDGNNNYEINPKDLQIYDSARITEVGFQLYSINQQKIFEFSHLVQPSNFTQTEFCEQLNGISQKDLETQGLPLKDLLGIFEHALENVDEIVAQNMDFDYNVFFSECYRERRRDLIELLSKKYRNCTLNMAWKLFPIEEEEEHGLEKRRLIDLYNFLFSKNQQQAHRAKEDCDMCAKCYFYMLNDEKYRKVLQHDEFQEFQVKIGKYKRLDWTIGDLVDNDKDYCHFIRSKLNTEYKTNEWYQIAYRLNYFI